MGTITPGSFLRATAVDAAFPAILDSAIGIKRPPNSLERSIRFCALGLGWACRLARPTQAPPVAGSQPTPECSQDPAMDHTNGPVATGPVAGPDSQMSFGSAYTAGDCGSNLPGPRHGLS